MGNDQSKLKGLEIDQKRVEMTDYWSLYNAELPRDDGSTLLSIFESNVLCPGNLTRATKNLMIYRHPSILKYVASWNRGAQKYLATERCRPLSLVVRNQSSVQICLGLRSVLSSLIFLVEQAGARHINICTSSIYVTTDGAWRLAGFEQVWKSSEITKKLLNFYKNDRYKEAVDPNEDKAEGQCLEQYAFAVLCDEILKNHPVENTAYVNEFREYCSTHLKHENVSLRPKLSAVLLHPYFNHEFVLIHLFLTELPLKSPQEKQEFFTGLIDKLRYFDEAIVASQLGSLLLSRMVLLDTTAQLCVTPYVLKTKTDTYAALFSQQTFKKHIVPVIKQIFCVRDAHIRLALLEHFNEYVNTLTKEELKDEILPHLLLGIKDINDILVARTLRCLADMVPILGSEVVIGGHRSRIFSDGRPQGPPKTTTQWTEPRSITPVMTSDEYMVSASPLHDAADVSGSYLSVTENIGNHLPIRLSPDGGEDIQATTDGEFEEDAWSDWDNDAVENTTNNEKSAKNNDNNIQLQLSDVANVVQEAEKDTTVSPQVTTPTTTGEPKFVVEDIKELDIKCKKISASNETEEIDFFKDMEPIIEISKNSLIITTIQKETMQPEEVSVNASRFEITGVDMCESGWDEEINDWTDNSH